MSTESEVSAHLRARDALLWVASPEEKRVERALATIAANNTYAIRYWDCASGVQDVTGKIINGNLQDPVAILDQIRSQTEREVWVLRDMHMFLKDPYVLRRLRNLARTLQNVKSVEARTVVLLSPTADVPPELSDHAVVVRWALPTREDIAGILDSVIRGSEKAAASLKSQEDREAAIEAAMGLTAESAASCYSKSMATQKGAIVPAIVAAEKRRVVSNSKGLEWFEPDPRGLDALGGLDVLKPWLISMRSGFSERARAFGLDAPKGVFLAGIPGCGKSLAAKAIATAFSCPLLRADLGASQSKYVGESQANIRAMFATAEALGRCVLWIDEIEKALAGATQGAADGGVAADALGTFLSWMQERKGEVFVVATANDVSKLPPELLRKGRFDEFFFVNLPTTQERVEILDVTLQKYKRELTLEEMRAVARVCDKFTGSEVAELVKVALRAAFLDGERDITHHDLIAAAKETTPLSKTMPEVIENLRKWAKARARPASREEVIEVSDTRDIDLQ